MKVDDLYGYKTVRPEYSAVLVMHKPTFWQRIFWGFIDLWENVVFPALLLAGALLCFDFAFLSIIRLVGP